MADLAVCRLDSNGREGAGLDDWGPSNPEAVIAGSPMESGFNFYKDATGQFTAGVWEATPGTYKLNGYSCDEYCHILSGKVVITDEQGHSETFTAGQSLVVPKGFKGTWHMPETLRKYYVIFEKKDG